EAGGVFAFGDWQNGVFMSQFHSQGSEVKGIYESFSTPIRTAVVIARSTNGDAFFVGNAVGFRNTRITVAKWNPVTGNYEVYGRDPRGVNGQALANAATCDSEGNLIIVGTHYQ